MVDGVKIEGTFRAHQVPLAGLAENPEHLEMLEEWMRSYKPEELFDENGTLIPELQELAPQGDRANGKKSALKRRKIAERFENAGFLRLCG